MIIYIYFWILVGISSGIYAGNYVIKNRNKFEDAEWFSDDLVMALFVIVGVFFWPVIIIASIFDL